MISLEELNKKVDNLTEELEKRDNKIDNMTEEIENLKKEIERNFDLIIALK